MWSFVNLPRPIIFIFGVLTFFVLIACVPDALAVSNPTIKGKIIFQDTFEGTLSNWTLSQVGTGNSAITSLTRNYVGAKSLAIQYTNGGSNYVVAAKDISTTSTDTATKVFFYDDGDSTLGTMFETRDRAKVNGTGLGVITDLAVCPACNPSHYAIRINSLQGTSDSGIARAVGWHVFEMRTNGTGTTAWIDGNELAKRNTSQTTLGLVQFVSTWGLTSTAFYDEIKILDSTARAACQTTVADTFQNLSKWTIAESYSHNTISFGGTNSVFHKMGAGSGYDLMTYVLCTPTQGKVSIDFYDDMTNKGTLFAIYSDDVEQNPSADLLGVGVWSNFNDKNTYLSDGDTYKYRVTNNFSPANSTIPTGIKRKQGWHKLELFSTPVGAFGRIDGINLTSLNGKKHDQGFTYNINTDPNFMATGIKSVGIVSTYNSTGMNYFANLRFEPIPTFTYTNTDASMRDLSFEISKYFIKQYPKSVQPSFYTDILKSYEPPLSTWPAHILSQEYNHMISVALVLAYDYRKNGDTTSLNEAIDLFKYVIPLAPEIIHCNSTPILMANYVTASKLLWDKLDTPTKRAARDLIFTEGNFWRDVVFDDATNNSCTNPWYGSRKRLPFIHTISATNFDDMNSAARDNAWTSAFFNLAGSFSPIILQDKNRAKDYRTLGEILAYHSLDRAGDPGFGIHPAATNEGTIPASATILDNYNMPLWSNPNPFYMFTTVQQIARGMVLNDLKPSTNFTTNYFHNWKNVVPRAEVFIDYSTLRGKSGAEITEVYQPNFESYDHYGKGSQYEDLAVQVDTLAALSKLPETQTGLSNATYKNRLFNMLRYEYYTQQGFPREPWYPSGIDPEGRMVDNFTAINTTVGPMDGWGAFVHASVSNGVVLPNTHHLAMVVNGVVALDHVYASLFLDPTFVADITSGDLNGDKSISIGDAPTVFQNYGKVNATSDLNLDGQVNNLDFRSLWQF